jgi:hypothetical protein
VTNLQPIDISKLNAGFALVGELAILYEGVKTAKTEAERAAIAVQVADLWNKLAELQNSLGTVTSDAMIDAANATNSQVPSDTPPASGGGA